MVNVTQSSRANSTRFVYVGCKLIHGLVMELFHENTIAVQPAPGNFNAMHKPPVVKASITLKGANSAKNDFTVRGLSQPNFPYAVTAVQIGRASWRARV